MSTFCYLKTKKTLANTKISTCERVRNNLLLVNYYNCFNVVNVIFAKSLVCYLLDLSFNYTDSTLGLSIFRCNVTVKSLRDKLDQGFAIKHNILLYDLLVFQHLL